MQVKESGEVRVTIGDRVDWVCRFPATVSSEEAHIELVLLSLECAVAAAKQQAGKDLSEYARLVPASDA